MEIITWIIIITILLVTYGIFNNNIGIPGPKALPLLGNLHQFNKTMLHVQLLEWAKLYGPVYRLWFGHKPVIIVTGSKQIHEVLVVKGNDFSGRSSSYILKKHARGEKNGIGYTDATQAWKVQKKLFMTTLKGYGSGLRRIEEITTRYTNEWMDEILKSSCENGIDIREHLVALTYNIINTIVLRKSLHTKENVSMIKHLVAKRASIMRRHMQFEGFLLDTFPLLRFIFPALTKDIDTLHEMQNTFFMNMKSKESDFLNNDEKGEKNISEHILLSNIVKYQMANNEIQIDDQMLTFTLMDAYSGGINTTSSSLSYLFYILACNRIIQENIQKEIDNIVNNECIHLQDKNRMPYAHATLLETLRFTSIAPELFPHRSTTETSIDGHHIPQNTEVWINAWGLHHDDAIWDEPFKFMPERFLDAAGAVVLADHPNRRNLVAFGAGPRVCPGETFAMSRMFLILTMVLQKFSVLPLASDDNQPTYDTRDINYGFLLQPPQYKVKFEARFEARE